MDMKAKFGGRHGRDEKGSTTLEMVLIFPAVVSILWLGLQVGISQYGHSTALAAAEAGARAGALEHATAGDCQAAAAAILAAGGDALSGTSVSCSRSGTTSTATVSGWPMSVGPWPVNKVTKTVSAPVERITSDANP